MTTAAVLLVGLGGAAGAVCRFAVDELVGGRGATVAVNVVGSFLLGAVAAALAADADAALVVGTGFCGAFTTFSSVAVAVAEDAEAGDRRRALGYAAGTFALAVTAAVGGGAVVSGF
jgi:CrcB protein